MAELRTGGNPIGNRNKQSANRNLHRKQFRLDNPEHRGKKLKRWPLEDYFPVKEQN